MSLSAHATKRSTVIVRRHINGRYVHSLSRTTGRVYSSPLRRPTHDGTARAYSCARFSSSSSSSFDEQQNGERGSFQGHDGDMDIFAAVALLHYTPLGGEAAFGASDEVLVLKRTVIESDPWSGHLAFPGGKREPNDETLLHTVVREVQEETSVMLAPEEGIELPLSYASNYRYIFYIFPRGRSESMDSSMTD
eukprot:TRINITY_DN2186_c0_g1_i1.p1 TRINITY_DN2186_c0_g1~~TRINITY_DN2186_c0_g1_i1.p1  ORF type:complete len:193 (+),score=9.40 TRINITY_DN2186_c0_g1_i1:145-723(+)